MESITDFIGVGYKAMLGKEVCNLCDGAKKVGDMNHNTDEEEIIVPCPECCADYYESVDNNQ